MLPAVPSSPEPCPVPATSVLTRNRWENEPRPPPLGREEPRAGAPSRRCPGRAQGGVQSAGTSSAWLPGQSPCQHLVSRYRPHPVRLFPVFLMNACLPTAGQYKSRLLSRVLFRHPRQPRALLPLRRLTPSRPAPRPPRDS